MKVNKILSRLARAPENHTELSRVGRSLANEFARQRLDVLRSFRAGLASIPVPSETFAAGYVAGLLDVTSEFEVYLREIDDAQHVARTALREDWRDVLEQLVDGAKLPSDLAARLSKDRPMITRLLKRMRIAGLVESFAADSLDGRLRPQRLTLQGRRLLEQLDQKPHTAGDLAQGIALAVALFRQLGQQPTSTLADLDATAQAILPEPSQAHEAVKLWSAESKRVGLLAAASPSEQKSGSNATPGHRGSETLRLSPDLEFASDGALWQRIPAILSALDEYKDHETPVFVRTSDSAWGAWAFALGQGDSTGLSRTIVKGDILARSLTPPDRRFALVYDNPAAIYADLEEPTMREFLERADNKFVIASDGDDIPEGFIALTPRESAAQE